MECCNEFRVVPTHMVRVYPLEKRLFDYYLLVKSEFLYVGSFFEDDVAVAISKQGSVGNQQNVLYHASSLVWGKEFTADLEYSELRNGSGTYIINGLQDAGEFVDVTGELMAQTILDDVPGVGDRTFIFDFLRAIYEQTQFEGTFGGDNQTDDVISFNVFGVGTPGNTAYQRFVEYIVGLLTVAWGAPGLAGDWEFDSDEVDEIFTVIYKDVGTTDNVFLEFGSIEELQPTDTGNAYAVILEKL